jgi:hypothetical protein
VIDDGEAIHYAAVRKGTPVYSSDEREVGRVEAMLDNYREHIFDGVVFKDDDGVMRFADAPEVARTAERGVTLAVSAEEAGRLPPPEQGKPSFRPNLKSGRFSRLFGGGWRKQ